MKKPKKPKSPAKSATKRKVAIKDLKAKDAGSVKGGAAFLKLTDGKHKDEIDVLNFH